MRPRETSRNRDAGKQIWNRIRELRSCQRLSLGRRKFCDRFQSSPQHSAAKGGSRTLPFRSSLPPIHGVPSRSQSHYRGAASCTAIRRVCDTAPAITSWVHREPSVCMSFRRSRRLATRASGGRRPGTRRHGSTWSSSSAPRSWLFLRWEGKNAESWSGRNSTTTAGCRMAAGSFSGRAAWSPYAADGRYPERRDAAGWRASGFSVVHARQRARGFS